MIVSLLFAFLTLSSINLINSAPYGGGYGAPTSPHMDTTTVPPPPVTQAYGQSSVPFFDTTVPVVTQGYAQSTVPPPPPMDTTLPVVTQGYAQTTVPVPPMDTPSPPPPPPVTQSSYGAQSRQGVVRAHGGY